MRLPEELQRWREEGRLLEVFGHGIFARVVAGDPDATPLAILHGFPTCSYDFHRVLPRLAQDRTVVVHDHLGFGLSDKPVGPAYSLIEQAEIAIELWRQLGLSRVHLLGHDYGTSVATELVARRERGGLPLELASLTLCNGSVHIELAQLTLTQKILLRPLLGRLLVRFSSLGFFRRRIRGLLADPQAISNEEIDVLWAALNANRGKRPFARIARYPLERRRFAERWIGPLTRFDLPSHVLWARLDPIAVPLIAETLAQEIPGARLTWLDDVGHYPMLESPERWAGLVAKFLSETEAA